MKWGTFIGIDWNNRRITGANREQMMMEEYMQAKHIPEPKDIIGPFEIRVQEQQGRRISDSDLHTTALFIARQEQKDLATKLQKDPRRK